MISIQQVRCFLPAAQPRVAQRLLSTELVREYRGVHATWFWSWTHPRSSSTRMHYSWVKESLHKSTVVRLPTDNVNKPFWRVMARAPIVARLPPFFIFYGSRLFCEFVPGNILVLVINLFVLNKTRWSGEVLPQHHNVTVMWPHPMVAA